MDLGASCGASLNATVLTRVSTVWNRPGGCESRGKFFWNHATFLAKALIILVGDRAR
jgi:hypothetical protein